MLRLITHVLAPDAEGEKLLVKFLDAYNNACFTLANEALAAERSSARYLSGKPRKAVQFTDKLSSGIANAASRHVASYMSGVDFDAMSGDEMAEFLNFPAFNKTVVYGKGTVRYGFDLHPGIPYPTEIGRMPLRVKLTMFNGMRPRAFDYRIRLVTIGQETAFWHDKKMALVHEGDEWRLIAARKMTDQQVAEFLRVRSAELVEDAESSDYIGFVEERDFAREADEDFTPAVDDEEIY